MCLDLNAKSPTFKLKCSYSLGSEVWRRHKCQL